VSPSGAGGVEAGGNGAAKRSRGRLVVADQIDGDLIARAMSAGARPQAGGLPEAEPTTPTRRRDAAKMIVGEVRDVVAGARTRVRDDERPVADREHVGNSRGRGMRPDRRTMPLATSRVRASGEVVSRLRETMGRAGEGVVVGNAPGRSSDARGPRRREAARGSSPSACAPRCRAGTPTTAASPAGRAQQCSRSGRDLPQRRTAPPAGSATRCNAAAWYRTRSFRLVNVALPQGSPPRAT